jgi:hypothetical protein
MTAAARSSRSCSALRAPEIERTAASALQRDAHVLDHGEMRKHRRDLERAPDAEPRHVRRIERGDVAAVEHDAALRGRKEFGEEIKAGGLAGAVRPDQGVNAAAYDAQIDRAHRDEAGKFLGQILGDQDRLFTHDVPPESDLRRVRSAPQRSSGRKPLSSHRTLPSVNVSLRQNLSISFLSQSPPKQMTWAAFHLRRRLARGPVPAPEALEEVQVR